MTLDAADLKDLTAALSDRLYLQVAGWHLYLGDAGLALHQVSHLLGQLRYL